jgi:ABC-type nickel/cobalt efflux system permease component RcnA
MTRKTLIIVFGISLFLSFSVQAGHRGKHDKQHHHGHVEKHHGHHQHHSHDHHWRGCRHVSNERYGRYAQSHVRPHVELGAQFTYSPDGAMIIYQPYLHGSVRY